MAGTIRAEDLELEPGPVEPAAALETVRRNAAAALARVLPEPEAGLAAGILIGLRERVDRELAADFTTAGVSHVVAISGWNIAIVAAAVAALGGSLGRRRRSVLTMLAIVAYVCFSGASPSVVRAAAMAGVVLLARESGRAGRAAAALGWAVVLLLLADPSLIADAGFQLSSLATAGLIAWATPIGERIGRFGGGRVPNWLAESLGVSLAAQAATLPVVLATFGRLALISPAANLCIVPVVPVAMAAGGVALGRGRPGGGRRAGGAGGDPRVPRLGGAHDHGRDRPVRRRCAVRERDARPAIERRRGARECRSRGSGGVAAPSAATATRRQPSPDPTTDARPEARGTAPVQLGGRARPGSRSSPWRRRSC